MVSWHRCVNQTASLVPCRCQSPRSFHAVSGVWPRQGTRLAVQERQDGTYRQTRQLCCNIPGYGTACTTVRNTRCWHEHGPRCHLTQEETRSYTGSACPQFPSLRNGHRRPCTIQSVYKVFHYICQVIASFERVASTSHWHGARSSKESPGLCAFQKNIVIFFSE